MTVNTTPVETNYTGDASTTVFALTFAFAANAHVKVYLGGVLQGSGYSITGAGNPSGGTLTFSAAPGSGVAIKARRVTPLTQEIDVVNNATVFASSLETGLDYALMRQQEEAFDRTALGVTFAIDAAAVDADAAAAAASAVASAASAASALAAKNAAETAETNAETAETAAELARDLAQGYAADAAGVSGVNVPLYASRSSASGATIAAGVKSIRTQYYAPTYASLDTLVGGAEYSRVSLATIAAAGYPALAYFRSTDRFMSDGTTDSTNGGYWLISSCGLCPTMFGAVGVYSTDSTAAITACFDTCRVRGGGRVLWARGIFKNTTTQLIPANTHVQGSGRGATILRSPAGGLTGRSVNGLLCYAQLAMVGMNNCSVRGVTVDHATNGTTANGIAMIRAGATAYANAWDAVANAPATNCVVEDCEVKFSVNSQYMIWNFQSNSNKILNNWLDGGITTNSAGPQEGIECFGGEDVLIEGNTVKNIGGNGIYVATETGFLGNSYVRVLNNYVQVARTGIRVVVAIDSDHLLIQGNQVKAPWLYGIYGTISTTKTIDTLDVLDNQVDGGPAPIFFEAEAGAFTKRIAICRNRASDGTGSGQAGIYVARYQNVTINDNDVGDITAFGISLEACTNFDVSRNRSKTTGRMAVYLNDCVDGKVSGNTLLAYNGTNVSDPGVGLTGACIDVAVFGNSYDPAVEAYAAYVTSGTASRIRIYDEILLYAHTFATTAFRNDGANPNTGLISPAATNTTNTVTNSLAREGSTILVQQGNGAAVRPVRVTQTDGAFSVIGAAAAGDETYRWQIRQ
jgi:hypothetical protein